MKAKRPPPVTPKVEKERREKLSRLRVGRNNRETFKKGRKLIEETFVESKNL